MYVFQLGRDKEISLLELIRVLSNYTDELPDIESVDNYVLLKDEVEIDEKELVSRLAGTLKIAEVFFEGDKVDQQFINSLDFYFPKNFEVYVTSNKKELAEQAVGELNSFKKANKMRGSIVIPDPSKIKPFAGEYEKLKDETVEILITEVDGTIYFSQVKGYTDANEFKFKDEARPAQKFTHGTSFRLAKMMVNILNLEKGRTMVDPFCGIGTFLIEGMMAGYDVIGIDNDESVIGSAKRNIKWARKQFGLNNSCDIRFADSTTEIYQADGCVFEPYMGPFMKKLPDSYEAEKVLNYLVKLYTATFQNLHKNLTEDGEVVCIIPSIQTHDGEVLEISEEIFIENGFQPVIDPIEYNTPHGSKILRSLWLLRKMGEHSI